MFHNKDGSLTHYALSCGHVQTFTKDGTKDYYGTDADAVALSYNGCTYDVHVRRTDGTTHDTYGHALWVEDTTTGARHRADWYQFDTLTEARRFWGKVRTAIIR